MLSQAKQCLNLHCIPPQMSFVLYIKDEEKGHMQAYFRDLVEFYHSYHIFQNLVQGDVHESLFFLIAKKLKTKFVVDTLENVHDANHG